MAKEILFKVRTEGGEEITKVAKSLNDLAIAQKQTQEALNNTKIGTEGYKKLSKELKDVEKAQSSAKTSTMSFGEKLGNLPGPLGAAAQGFGGLTKASLQFLATPIGAVVGLIGIVFAAVTKAVKSNEGAMDALTKVTDTFAGIVQPLFDFLAKVATVVLEGIADGLAAVGDFFGLAGSAAAKFSEQLDKQKDLEKDLSVTRAQTNKQLAEAREILSDSNATYAERTAALKQVQASEAAQSAQEVNNKKELLKLAQQQVTIDGQSEENIQKIREAKIALAEVEQDSAAKGRQFNKLQKSLDKEVEAAADEKKKADEARGKEAAAKAKARADAALALEKEGLKAKQKAVDEAYLLSIADENVRAQEALKIQQRNQDSELQIKIDGLEKIKKRTKEENSALATLKGQQAAEDIAQVATTEALITKQKADAEKKRIDDEKKAADESKAATEKAYADKQSTIDNAYKIQEAALIQSGATEDEIKKQQDAADLERLQKKIDAAKAAGQVGAADVINLELELATKKAEIADADLKKTEDDEKKKADIRMQTFNGIIQAASSVTNAIAAIQEAQMQKELNAAGDNLAKQEEIKKKYFEKQKKVQIANAIIGTIQGAVQAFTSLSAIPVVGPILGGIAAAAALVAGYANVEKIKNTKYEGGGGGGGGGGGDGAGAAPKPAPTMFASGGYISGPGTGTSDSIPARLSNGESVINANSTAQFGGLLSMINEAGGGKKFAEGGMANGSTNMPVVKTYVIASDVTSQQEADFRIQQIARL